MKLFKGSRPVDLSDALYAEPRYRFLNRSTQSRFQAVRDRMQGWADECPELVNRAWLNQFKDQDDRQHFAAFFELFTCVLLKRQGHQVEREPVIQSDKHPDFLVRRNGGVSFYVECCLVAGSNYGGVQQRQINLIYDRIETLDSPNFYLEPKVLRAGTSQDLNIKFNRSVETWLASLDPSKGPPWSNWTWSGDGWEIEFEVIAREVENRGKPGIRPTIGVLDVDEFSGGNSVEALYLALENKATHMAIYKRLT